MSRIGNRKVVVPAGVTVTNENNVVTVKGPKGELSLDLVKGIEVNIEENTLTVTRPNDEKATKAMHGTTNANIHNMIMGVTEGFKKALVINAGYSHPVELSVPAGLTVEQVSNTEITVSGIDKVLVGKFAAEIRDVRQPEPYKGKGIRYKDEFIRRKEGKKAA